MWFCGPFFLWGWGVGDVPLHARHTWVSGLILETVPRVAPWARARAHAPMHFALCPVPGKENGSELGSALIHEEHSAAHTSSSPGPTPKKTQGPLLQ